jgi:hypothetical protein
MLSPFPFAYTQTYSKKQEMSYPKAKLPKILSEAFGLKGQDLAKALKDIASGKLSKETEQALAKSETAGKRAGVAEEIVKRQIEVPGAKYGELPGVAKETVAGKQMPIPESTQNIGT